ncbi:hypothetical protein Belba_1463 [Belliella baltica DSM 15883]|uniref:Uncharacterized protein n=1 Tax=Belliella baltica (strain DSM 15883 / CIP 108006 / LMG 21964 / BA134) TaxID=866536 RepID=I3Z4B2_BELBD|nr:hypothetical protein [Belliella baltica]AFL84080.1 hypothetical protein Belba_1463 [Belliella baltica DSM 15883]
MKKNFILGLSLLVMVSLLSMISQPNLKAQHTGPIYESCFGNQNEVGHHIYAVKSKFCGSGTWGQGEIFWEDCDPYLQQCCPMMDFEPEPPCLY